MTIEMKRKAGSAAHALNGNPEPAPATRFSQALKRKLKQGRADRSGNVGIMFGLMLVPIVTLIGATVDYSRATGVKSKIQSSLDSAVIAAGREYQIGGSTTEAQTVASTYFGASFKSNVEVELEPLSINEVDSTLTMRATAAVPTTFLSVVGLYGIEVSAQAEAQVAVGGSGGGGGGGNIEVSMMLDVTGSMCADGYGPCTSSTKMDALKEAAKDLVDIVTSSGSAKVAVVPFSTRVRVGPDGGGGDMMLKLTNLPATWSGWYRMCTRSTGGGGSEGNGTWTCTRYEAQSQSNWKIMPCVTDRFYNSGWRYDYTDDAPAANKWLLAHGGDRMPYHNDSTDATPTQYRGLTSSDPARHWNYAPWGIGGECADIANENEILPLTTDGEEAKDRIEGLKAFGATSGALGTAWTWYTLSPRWNETVWDGENEPGSYADLTTLDSNGKPLLRKVAVLMSDGVYNTYRGWKDQNKTDMSNYAKQLCTNMKTAGIEIYTVGFALDELTSADRTIAESTLSNCGSSIDHFYNTLTTDDLKQAFRDIAMRMSTLRLSR